jgi:arylsulfatase A-like enzyme
VGALVACAGGDAAPPRRPDRPGLAWVGKVRRSVERAWLDAERALGWAGAVPELPPRLGRDAPHVEPGVVTPSTPVSCWIGDTVAPAAVWTVDGAEVDRAPSPPLMPGAVLRCGASGATLSRAVAVRGERVARNLLFVLLDDVGITEVSAYGMSSSTPTPRLDRLASEGVRFERAWSEPVCSPTRASVLTGLHPSHHGLGVATSDVGGGKGLDDRHFSMADMAAERGVGASGVFGKWHVGAGDAPDDHPARFGFTHHVVTPGNFAKEEDDYFHFALIRDGRRASMEGYLPSLTIDAATRFIRDSEARLRPDQGWLAWVALNLAHAPYHAPPADLATVNPGDMSPNYLAMVRAADTLVGRLLDAIPPEVLAETVVVVMGDNGTPEAQARAPFSRDRVKTTVYEGGIRVPLIVSGASIVGAGRLIEAPVSAVDLLPTFADLLGAPLTPAQFQEVDGRSFAAHLWSTGAPRDEHAIVAELFSPNGHEPSLWRHHAVAITDGRFKMILEDGRESWYDLRADPYEAHELSARGAVPEGAITRLRGALAVETAPRPWPPPSWSE